MRPIQIENWALDVIQRVESGQPNEDARVELKAKWIPPHKAARQLAGHANSARGDSVMWLIGIDQDDGVIGADHKELADWFAAVVSQFDGVAPTMVDVNVFHHDKTVVALHFETDRAPFVVRNPTFGVESGVSIAFEVPWREGTQTRTATRSDLVRLLVPLLQLPDVETLGGEFILRKYDKYRWYIQIEFYMTPHLGTSIVIPFHRCEVLVKLPALETPIVFQDIKLMPPYKRKPGPVGSGWEPDSFTITNTQNELIIEGPGRVDLSGNVWSEEPPPELQGSTAQVQAKLLPTHAIQSVVIAETMKWTPSDVKDEIARWKL
jgi:hypothetical protein